MKILFVIDGMEFGGGERVFLQLIRQLEKEKYEIFAACAPDGDFGNRLKEMGIPVEPLRMENRFNPFAILKLARIIRKRGVQIVHSQGARADFFARMSILFSRNCRLVCTVAMPVEGFNVGALRKWIYGLFDRFSERYVDRFIVVSEVLKKTFINNHKIPPEKVIKIYNGIELQEYQLRDPHASSRKIRTEYNIDENFLLVGAIGRMVWQKGFEFLIEAVPEVLNKYRNVKFLFAGEGPLKKSLEMKCETLKVKDNIIFTGFRRDVREFLSAIDLLVIPSLREGFPFVTLEAMASGKPMVATMIDGITEQITSGENGLLTPPKDSLALAEGILRLINDKEFAKKIGSEARKKVEECFSIEKMVSETKKVYHSL